MNIQKAKIIGVISDSHGHISSSVIHQLKITDLILHAGDIDTPEVLSQLKTYGSVCAVKGNMDRGAWSSALPFTEVIEVGQIFIYLIHDLNNLDLDPKAAGFNIVVSGHTHEPFSKKRNGVLFLNPGSISYPRNNTPASMALLKIKGSRISLSFVEV